MAAKLTLADVLQILKMLKQGYSPKSVAEMYDVTQSTISKIVTGRIWSRVTGKMKK